MGRLLIVCTSSSAGLGASRARDRPLCTGRLASLCRLGCGRGCRCPQKGGAARGCKWGWFGGATAARPKCQPAADGTLPRPRRSPPPTRTSLQSCSRARSRSRNRQPPRRPHPQLQARPHLRGRPSRRNRPMHSGAKGPQLARTLWAQGVAGSGTSLLRRPASPSHVHGLGQGHAAAARRRAGAQLKWSSWSAPSAPASSCCVKFRKCEGLWHSW